MSTASGTLLAPSVTFTENVLRRVIARDLSDRRLLLTMRAVVVGFAAVVTAFALRSENLRDGRERLQGDAGGRLRPPRGGAVLAGGPRRRQGRCLHGGRPGTWLALEALAPNGVVPPKLAGLAAAAAGMIVGSLATRPAAEHAPPAPSGAAP